MRKMPALPLIKLGIVDVRDVAQAHLEAIKLPDAAGNRFLLVENSYHLTEIGNFLNSEFKNKGYSPVTRQLPKFLMWGASLFSPKAASYYKVWGKNITYDNSKTTDMLGINFIPMQ